MKGPAYGPLWPSNMLTFLVRDQTRGVLCCSSWRVAINTFPCKIHLESRWKVAAISSHASQLESSGDNPIHWTRTKSCGGDKGELHFSCKMAKG